LAEEERRASATCPSSLGGSRKKFLGKGKKEEKIAKFFAS